MTLGSAGCFLQRYASRLARVRWRKREMQPFWKTAAVGTSCQSFSISLTVSTSKRLALGDGGIVL